METQIYRKFNFLCGVSSSIEIPPESCGSLEENCNNGHTSSWYDGHISHKYFSSTVTKFCLRM